MQTWYKYLDYSNYTNIPSVIVTEIVEDVSNWLLIFPFFTCFAFYFIWDQFIADSYLHNLMFGLKNIQGILWLN